MNKHFLDNLHERELHPFLNYYLNHSLGIAAKTIYQERSINSTKGENEWIHPDMVGYSLTTSDWSEKVVSLAEQYNVPKVILYSFELKKEITMSNLREVFFQAVSNSSWANEGYLVAVEIDTTNTKLVQKMNRLSNSFGIGIIKLNLDEPTTSKLVTAGKRKEEIDGDTVNNLFEINKDFKDFLADVERAVKINRPVNYNLDEVKTLEELKEVLTSVEGVDVQTVQATSKPDAGTSLGNEQVMDWSINVTGKKPKRMIIYNEEYEAQSWKQVYITFCKYLAEKDLTQLKQTKLTGRNRDFFSTSDKNLRVAYLLEEVNLFIEVNLSAQQIINNVKALIKEFNLDITHIKIILDMNN